MFREALRASPDAVFIARRLFVTNSIDSLLSALGVNVGAFEAHVDPMIMAMAVLGGSLSLSVVSGLLGVFLSERAERIRELRELERKLGADLSRSLYARSAQLIPLYVALWSSAGMLVFPLASITPYVAAKMKLLSIHQAFALSIAIILASLTMIGAYLGRITGERLWLSSLRVLALGVIALVIVLVFKTVLGIAFR